MKKKSYPYWAYPVRRLWLRHTRKEWTKFKKIFGLNSQVTDIFCGRVYYPPEVYEWLNDIRDQIPKMDKIMKDYYKKA